MLVSLSNSTETLSSHDHREPVLLCAADDHYVKSLTVTLHSAAQNLRGGGPIHAIVLDGGITESNWQAIQESLANLPIELYAVRPSLDPIRDLGISHHVTHTAYLRLLAGRLLPNTIDRVIYFDSDLLIQNDISELWQLDLGDDYALAVPDIACPFVDARHAACNFKKSSPFLCTLSPIRNWQQLRLDPSSYYFNSGVMMLNIRRMREESIEQQLLDCLRENRTHVWCWDQYALNVIFARQWRPLPLHWNVGAHIYEFPDESCSPFHVDDFRQAVQRPSIIHFTTEWKPWDFESNHPLRERFFEQLDQTAFQGWRPVRPEFKLRKSWDAFWAEFFKQSAIQFQLLRCRLSKQPEAPVNRIPCVIADRSHTGKTSIVTGAS